MSRFGESAAYGAMLGLLTFAMAGAAIAAPMAPNRAAVASEQPTVPPAGAAVPGVTCTATGSWSDDDGSGAGTWTKTARLKCHLPGTWTDAFSYTWKLKKSARGQVTGTVTYHGIPGCEDDTWPATGTFKKNNFTVTATNPVSGGACASFFGYTMTIQ